MKCFLERGLIYPRVFYFPTIGDYASVLENAGFKVVFAALFDRPTPQRTQSGLTDCAAVCILAADGISIMCGSA